VIRTRLRCPIAGHPIRYRIGLSSRPVIGGIVGNHKFQYDVYGDAVNTASRMESQGEADHIQVSEATRALLADGFVLEPRGLVEIKGKGLMETFYLIGEKEQTNAPVDLPDPDQRTPRAQTPV
jgi:adenylate cyclase